MITLTLIGIGTGNPDHLTLQAITAMRQADLVLIPLKGDDKADLAGIRRAMLDRHLTKAAVQLAEFELPRRDAGDPDYLGGVDRWHDAIAEAWRGQIDRHLPDGGKVALLVWGDPSLYDSSLRIAARLDLAVSVIPGITAIQALCAAHAIPLNDLGAPVQITTGRQLRDHGWPEGVERLVVMLDGGCAFDQMPGQTRIWWGAFLGMPQQMLEHGTVAQVGPRIIDRRAAARAGHGWIMDCYLLARA